MSAITVLFVLIMIVLAALMADHYSRLAKMGWAPPVDDYRQGRSLMDPVGGALGEIGRADGLTKIIGAAFDALGTVTGLVYAPIGAGLGAIGKGLELAFKPIGAALGAMTGFGLKH